MDAVQRLEAFHNPDLWASLTPTQKRLADLMEEIDPATGRPLTIEAIRKRLGTSRQNVYKVLKQIGAKAAKLAP